MGRGRPANPVPTEAPKKFTRVYHWEDGTVCTWYYNLNVTQNGPVKVEMDYPKNLKTFEDQQEELPITKRKFFNPANQKYVGYGRAKQLGLL